MKHRHPNEAYRLWYEFLLLSDRDQWAPHVKEHFGDIEEGKFDDWWETHQHLFEELSPFTIEVISDVNEYIWYTSPLTERVPEINQISDTPKQDNEASNDDDAEDILVIAVNRIASRSDLIEAFKELLISEDIGKPPGRAPYEKYNAIYSLFCLPNIKNLNEILDVYRLKMTTNLSNVEIEEELQINPRNGIWFKKAATTPLAKQYKRNQQNSIINRHLADAKQIIENVAFGEFPAKVPLTKDNIRNSYIP